MVLSVFVDVNAIVDLIREKLGWDYSQSLDEGIAKTYNWIKEQLDKNESNYFRIQDVGT